MEEYERTGAPPPANTIADKLGVDPPTVSKALKQLLLEGVLSQPYGPRSPYIPVQRPDGTKVRPVLVEIGKEPESVERGVVDLLREALRKAEEEG